MPQWKEHRPSILRPKFAKNLELGFLFCLVLFCLNQTLTHQEMVPRWISTKNIHAKDKPAQLCAHVPPPPLTDSGISK